MAGIGRGNILGFQGNGYVQVLHEVKKNPPNIPETTFTEAYGEFMFPKTIQAIVSEYECMRSQALTSALLNFANAMNAVKFIQHGILSSALECFEIADSSEETKEKVCDLLVSINRMRAGRVKFISGDALDIIFKHTYAKLYQCVIPLTFGPMGKKYFERNDFGHTAKILDILKANHSNVDLVSIILEIIFELVDLQKFVFWFCSDLSRLEEIEKCLSSESPEVKAHAAKVIARLAKFDRAKKSLNTIQTCKPLVEMTCGESDANVLRECLGALTMLTNDLSWKIYCAIHPTLNQRLVDLWEATTDPQAKLNQLHLITRIAEQPQARDFFMARGLGEKIEQMQLGPDEFLLLAAQRVACGILKRN